MMVPVLRFPEFREAGEWEEKQLGNIGKFTGGGTPSKENDSYWKGSIPWISSSDIFEDSIHKINISRFITNEALKDSATKMVPKNSILLVSRVGVGKLAISQQSLCTSQDFTNFTPVNDNSTFLAFYLKSYSKILLSFSQGMAIKGFTKEDISKLNLFLPPLPEQQKIAAFLTSIDDLIAAQSQKIKALQTHKKGLMQQLFPAEGEMVPSVRFGEFKDSGDWGVCKIGDFIDSYKGGAALTPNDFVSYSNFEVIPKKAINEGLWLKIDSKNPTYCSEEFYNKNHQSLVDSTYLITTLRDLVPSGPSIGYIVKYTGEKKYILAQGVYGLKPKKTLIPEFLIHFSNTIHYRKLVNAIMVGSTQVHIRNSDFLSIPIHVPAINEQQKIANCLNSLDEFITAQTQKLEELKAQKKALMQQLFPNSNETAS